MDDLIARTRRFNRFYTRSIGLLGERYLESPFSLSEARVIYELANREAPTATEIGTALGMDPGYLSRILKRLEGLGLIHRASLADDRRQSRVTLTEDGHVAFAQLDFGARREIGAMLERLPPAARTRLADAMEAIEGALDPKPAGEIRLRLPQPGDLGWVIERHGALYAQEEGWNMGFERHVAQIVAQLTLKPDPIRERIWIAERDGVRLGCVFLAKEDETTARLRLLLLEPEARGAGLGRRLVEEALGFAREAGYRQVVLWTHASLKAARRIYAELGFQKIHEDTHTDYGPVAVAETWTLAL
jgi:DNA-binding MarR family transcriptional regulator/GNAT superfamily N-acetyltransferase